MNIRYIIIVCLVLVFSCSPNKDNRAEKTYSEEETYPIKHLGKYVYIDGTECLHIDRDCFNVSLNRSESYGRINYQVSIVETKQMTAEPKSYCVNCVGDEDYEKIKEIIYANVENKDTRSSGYSETDTVAEYDH